MCNPNSASIPGQDGGAIAVRTRQAAERPPADHRPDRRAHPGGLGRTSFHRIPPTLKADRRLKPIDHVILEVLLHFAVWRKDSCWCTIPTIARHVANLRQRHHGQPFLCDRTVQRAIRRLIQAGWIEHRRVPKPDPDDARNTTGWRFYFLWMDTVPRGTDAETRTVEGPQTPHAGVTKPSPRKGATEVTKESGDPLVTQRRFEIRQLDRKTSSSSQPHDPDPAPAKAVGPGTDDDDISSAPDGEGAGGPEWAPAVETARRLFEASDAAAIAEDAARIGRKIGGRWECYRAALFLARLNRAQIRKLLPWLLATTLDFAAHGISAEAKQAEQRVLRQARERAAYEARLKATLDDPETPGSGPGPGSAPVEDRPGEAEIAAMRSIHDGHRGDWQWKMARAFLVRWGLLVPESQSPPPSPAVGAAVSPARPDPPEVPG